MQSIQKFLGHPKDTPMEIKDIMRHSEYRTLHWANTIERFNFKVYYRIREAVHKQYKDLVGIGVFRKW